MKLLFLKYDNLNQQFNLHFCISELIFPLHTDIIKSAAPLTTEDNIVRFYFFNFIFPLMKYAF